MIKLSIIIAVFNAEKNLGKCIESISKYITPECELIIVDGKSTDKSLEIIKKYQDTISYWISEVDSGIYSAWNKGIRKARGEYISFIGADDEILPNYIDDYIQFINLGNKYDYISSKALIEEESKINIIGAPWNFNAFKKFMTTAHVGSIHHRRLFDEVGVYDEEYKIAGDYELLLRKKNRLHTAFIDNVTIKMGGFGISNINYKLALKETMKAKIKTNSRCGILAYIDYIIAISKIFLKKIL